MYSLKYYKTIMKFFLAPLFASHGSGPIYLFDYKICGPSTIQRTERINNDVMCKTDKKNVMTNNKTKN